MGHGAGVAVAADPVMVGRFDYSLRVAEDATTYYLQLEFKVPKGAPANLTISALQRLTDAFERGLHP